MIVVVMGVSGSGKSTVGVALARALDWPFIDADDLHPPANVAKMAAGTPLTDEDRWPWLDRIVLELQRVSAAGPSRGRPREQGEAEARSARLRAWTAADTQSSRTAPEHSEAARNPDPLGAAQRRMPQAWGDHTSASAGNVVLACSALKQAYRDRLVRAGDMRFVHLRGDAETIAARLAARQHRYMPATLLGSQFATLEPPRDAIDIDIRMSVDAQVQAIVEALEVTAR